MAFTSASTRSSGPVLDPDFVFPAVSKLSTQLPDIGSVIGMVRHHMRAGFGVRSEVDVIREVAKQVYSKWWHDTIYCISLEGIIHRITTLHN